MFFVFRVGFRADFRLDDTVEGPFIMALWHDGRHCGRVVTKEELYVKIEASSSTPGGTYDTI